MRPHYPTLPTAAPISFTHSARPFAWRRRRRLQGLRQFTVMRLGKTEDSGSFFMGLGAFAIAIRLGKGGSYDLGTLFRAEWAGGKQWLLAFGYPQRLILPLANELSRCCQVSSPESAKPTESPAVRVVEDTLDP